MEVFLENKQIADAQECIVFNNNNARRFIIDDVVYDGDIEDGVFVIHTCVDSHKDVAVMLTLLDLYKAKVNGELIEYDICVYE